MSFSVRFSSNLFLQILLSSSKFPKNLELNLKCYPLLHFKTTQMIITGRSSLSKSYQGEWSSEMIYESEIVSKKFIHRPARKRGPLLTD